MDNNFSLGEGETAMAGAGAGAGVPNGTHGA